MLRRELSALLLAVPAFCAIVVAAQAQSNEGLGVVTGRVICADTQLPARLAHVVLQPVVDLKSPVLSTDNHNRKSEGIFHLQTVGLDGTFTIPGVPEGRYYVIAELDGYISPLALFTRAQLNEADEAMQQKIARYMTPISVTAGHATRTEVALIRGAAIAGTVRFEDGAPVVNSNVALLERNSKGEWETVRTGQLASHNSDFTNDRGAYRFSGLPAGEYLVRASIELNSVVLDHVFEQHGATAFGDGFHLRAYPGDAFRPRDAKPVKVEEGEDVTSLDVDVPLSKLYTLSGTVLQPNSATPANAAHLSLNFADTDEELTSADVNGEDGSFRFDFVPGGTYTLHATRIGEVERTEVPTCAGCIPPTHTETKVINKFGDVSMPIQLANDQSGVVLQATQSKKQ